MRMKWLGAWLARSELESQSHMWKHKATNGVSMRSSQMNENDATNVSIFNGLNQFKWKWINQ